MMNSMNWSKYNNELISRGQGTFWFEHKIVSDWYSDQTVGGRYTYSDIAINALLTLKYFYSLTFREVKGFAASLVELMGLDIEIPCYTTLSRRQKRLSVKIINFLKKNKTVHSVVEILVLRSMDRENGKL